MDFSELSDGGFSGSYPHLSSWDERGAAAAYERVVQAQVVAERIQQGMGIIERVIGSDEQYAHVPARVRNLVFVLEQGFGEQVKGCGWMRRGRMQGVSQ